MNNETFKEAVELRDKREELTHLLDRLNNNENNPRVSVEYYSDLFDEFLHINLREFEDLQNELNNVVKNWLVNKIEKIDNRIKEL
jgi:hypothetical protein